jgi:NADH-quinone oxidoreductase subunit L
MFNMGGLRKKMPTTFWTFLVGGFALSGFPLLTAGFWSKDEILADAWGHGHLAVFITLALAALLTAFYTMRQITLTFFGEARTKAAEHAHETPRTMTLPLAILSVFAIGAGWVGIPEHFPGIGGLLPNWFHDFVGGTLLEHPEAVEFNMIPLLTSLAVALGGLLLGWLVYRGVKAGAEDPLRKPLGGVYSLLENKYYFDEIYNFLIVRPAYWFAEQFSYLFLDRRVIDGILHSVARAAFALGGVFRNKFDAPVVNGFGDLTAGVTQWFGRGLRKLQSGLVQQYMLVAILVTFGGLFYYLLRVLQ